jgi:hypothetical protein
MKKIIFIITILSLIQFLHINAMQQQSSQSSWIKPICTGLGVAGSVITYIFGKRFLDTHKKLQPFQKAKSDAQHNLDIIATIRSKAAIGWMNPAIRKSSIRDQIVYLKSVNQPNIELLNKYLNGISDNGFDPGFGTVKQSIFEQTFEYTDDELTLFGIGNQNPDRSNAANLVKKLRSIQSANEQAIKDNEPKIQKHMPQHRKNGALTLVGLGLAGAGAGLFWLSKKK